MNDRRTSVLDAGWSMYARGVLPGDHTPGTLAYQEAQRAFYGGCAYMFSVLAACGDESVSEMAGAKALARVEWELARFATDVAEGRA